MISNPRAIGSKKRAEPPKKVSLLLFYFIHASAVAYQGGTPVTPTDVPGVVALPQLGCTAVKISPRHLLTAGHCLTREHVAEAAAALQKPGLTIQIGTRAAQMRTVTAKLRGVFVHPSFWQKLEKDSGEMETGPQDENDLGLIEVDGLAGISAATWSAEKLRERDPVRVGGYGLPRCMADEDRRAEGFSFPGELTYAPKETRTLKKTLVKMDRKNLGEARFSFACAGDSGAPVYAKSATGKPQVVGILSGSVAERVMGIRDPNRISTYFARLDGEARSAQAGALSAAEWIRRVLDGKEKSVERRLSGAR